jgi:MFS transporter, OPA family, glycerol-3-phosphate transporter
LGKMQNKLTFWNIWSSYATYYFGKVNLSIVVPALLVTYKDLSLMNVGLISSGFFFAYAFGQFLHGQISERCNPFVYISVGLIGSAVVNLILGFSAGFFIILVVGEIIDGMFQSMGWSSCVRANALTQKAEDRERTTTILGTSYQVGNSVAWLISAYAVGAWGWRAGFWVAAAFLFVRGMLLLVTKPKIEFTPPKKANLQIRNTLSFPIVLSGLSLCLLNMVRYGVIIWIPLYLFENQNLIVEDMGKVGLKVCLIPIAGVVGTLVYNRFKVSKDVITVIFLILLSISFVMLPFTEGLLATVLLLAGSFFLYGPHVFLVTTMPTRFVEQQVVAASTGFIDGMGYIGTVLIGVIIPILLPSAGGNWTNVFIFWAILSVMAAVFVTIVYFAHFRFDNRIHIHDSSRRCEK